MLYLMRVRQGYDTFVNNAKVSKKSEYVDALSHFFGLTHHSIG